MLRFDMSEYKQKEDVAKLIGNRGTRTKGQLTEGVKQKPYCVLLLDEIEKADGEVLDLFLQVLDDGRLTDATGRLVSFKNTIVIMTTNVGAKKIIDKAELKGNFKNLTDRERQQFERSMENVLQREFRPEYLNRIENKLIFNLLESDVIEEIERGNLEVIKEVLDRNSKILALLEILNKQDLADPERTKVWLVNLAASVQAVPMPAFWTASMLSTME